MKRCEHVKADGEQCGSDVGPGFSRCIWHDPVRQEEARAARRRGAAATNAKKRPKYRTASKGSVPRRPETIEDAIEWASWAVWAVATGEVDARTAQRGRVRAPGVPGWP